MADEKGDAGDDEDGEGDGEQREEEEEAGGEGLSASRFERNAP